MGKVYKSIKVKIPVGKNIICHRTQGCRVEKVINTHAKSKNGNLSRKRVLIGYVAGPTTMYPNDNYAKLYPKAWNELTKNKIIEHNIISIGLKSVISLIVNNTVLDDIHRSVFGTPDTNLIYDHAMYSLLTKESSAKHFESVMSNHSIFIIQRE